MARPYSNPRRRPRDKDGWRIPKPGTLSYKIYIMSKQWWRPAAIAKVLGRKRGTIQRMLQDIKGIKR